ncbi:MAG: MFS transporter [Actinobacteria bacterium]|nr:MAG: MFS transporter [Actinomycetota bacterium]
MAVAAVSACRPIRHSIHELRVWQSGVVRPLAALYRVIFGSDTDPALRPILGINFAGSLAGSTVWSFVGIWAIKKLGADQSVLGLAYLVSALIGVGSGYLGGHLSDHFGRRPLIFIGWIGQTAVVLGFVAAGSSATTGLLVLCFGGLFFQIGNAAGQALVADLVPRDRHEPAYAAVRVASNLGVTFGPPLGGLLLLLGSWNALFLGAAAFSAVGFALAVLFLPARGAYAPEEPPGRGSFAVIARDRPFLLFLVSAAFAWLVYVAFETVLPISLVESHGYSSSTWGFLVVLNPFLVTFFQLRLTERVAAVPGAVKLAVGLPLMGLPFLLLSVNDALPLVMLILFLFVIGEMLWVPTSQTAVAGLAPLDLRGAYMGAFGSMGAIGFALAPFIGLQVRKSFGDSAVWILQAALSLVAAGTGAAAIRIALGRGPDEPEPVSATV